MLGRFISPDPVMWSYINPYAYAGNNAVAWVDWWGMWVTFCLRVARKVLEPVELNPGENEWLEERDRSAGVPIGEFSDCSIESYSAPADATAVN